MSVADMPTQQEDDLYAAMMNGDTAAIDQLRDAAASQEQSHDLPWPDGWLPPTQQFAIDYRNATVRYHAANELPETEREANTATAVDDENTAAAAASELTD